jgi:predicted lipoprotein with Yx(FWY)xxD motif
MEPANEAPPTTRPRHRSRSKSPWLIGAALGGLALVAAACGSSAATPTTTTHPLANPPATAPTSGAVTVTSARVGSLGTILVSQSGLTLYRYTPDGKGKTTCTGTCAVDWPPLTLPAGTTTPTGSGGVSTTALGTITRPGGALQVTFDGMPLYRFSWDSGPGQAHGQGVGGIWFVLSPSTTSAVKTPSTTPKPSTTAKPSSTPTTQPAAGGYGY